MSQTQVRSTQILDNSIVNADINASAAIVSSKLTLTAITNFGLRDTSAAYDLTIAAVSTTALSAGKTLTIDVDNGARTLALKKSLSITTGDVTLIGNAAGSSITLPTTGTVATLAGSETLSGKTLTEPKFVDLGFLADANGNEILILDTVTSAVNEITLANGATGNNASLTASGETNAGITIIGKGTKGVSFGNAMLQKVSALSDGATPALNASLANVFTLSAAGDRTIAVPSNAVSGQKIVIAHTASGGARTLSLNTGAGGFRFGSDISALTQTASGKTDYVGCIYNGTDSFWDIIAVVKGY